MCQVYTAGPGGCKLLALNKAKFNHQLSSLHESLMDQVRFHWHSDPSLPH